ncbi:methyltransferase type 11 [Sphingobacterium sp. CZ-UAM]|uniref:methyltransferase type 11 n=1 Tax=Sphingobacterium sp. CZ-UAM TaxID=1933868 RepID=UPI000984C3F6|nr:methyltransferase type 11 [Sphingobacterium sp. CZ-UAM]OOG16103.1 methyltransferase type 11 [Sphingobacterium sp. CZ-UAM]
MKRVVIFKTNVNKYREAKQIVMTLLQLFSSYKVNFDLDDEERILRIESTQTDIETKGIIKQMLDWGYQCEHIK